MVAQILEKRSSCFFVSKAIIECTNQREHIQDYEESGSKISLIWKIWPGHKAVVSRATASE